MAVVYAKRRVHCPYHGVEVKQALDGGAEVCSPRRRWGSWPPGLDVSPAKLLG